MTSKVFPVILSGGSGTRLWPLSRTKSPKQLLALTDRETMMQKTALRVAEPEARTLFEAPVVVCNVNHGEAIERQLADVGVALNALILEPEARNTAAAAAVAALSVAAQAPQGLMLMLPADHHIGDVAGFRAAIARGVPEAEDGRLVTFGIVPSHAETGYGYIKQGEPSRHAGVFHVERFVEKPNRETAARYLAEGGYAWNAGIFLARVDGLLSEMARHSPDILEAATRAVDAGKRDAHRLRLDPARFSVAPNISFDYAVMEHTTKASLVPVSMGWNDVGSFAALWDVAPKDGNRNWLDGDVIALDAKDSLVRSTSRLVVVAGIKDLIVIETEDAVLVVSRERAQDVGAIAKQIKASGRDEH